MLDLFRDFWAAFRAAFREARIARQRAHHLSERDAHRRAARAARLAELRRRGLQP